MRSFFAVYPKFRIAVVDERFKGPYGRPPENVLRGVDGHVLRCGAYAPGGGHERADISFPELFYRQLGIPYIERWNSCPIEKAAALVPQLSTPHQIFVHDDAARGYHILREINAKPAYRPAPGHSILAFAEILRAAREIHCIDSAF